MESELSMRLLVLSWTFGFGISVATDVEDNLHQSLFVGDGSKPRYWINRFVDVLMIRPVLIGAAFAVAVGAVMSFVI